MNTPVSSEATSPSLSANHTISNEIEGLKALQIALKDGLKAPFEQAVATIRAAAGRVIVTGMGKSGHIARKVAATLASTGTPAFFVHPGEASHGDLGMIKDADVVLAMSWSGETAELASIISYSRRFKVPLIGMSSNPESTLATQSDIHLTLPKVEEACPHGLAPTTSCVMQLSLGDALSIALLESHGFTAQDFKIFHPGGSLGASLQYVRDLMHQGDKMPLVGVETQMSEVIVIMSQKGFGCVGVLDDDGKLVGMVTDGDLRRNLSTDLLAKNVQAVMTKNPKTLGPDILVPTAIELLNKSAITAIFVVDDKRPVGLLHMHDFLRVGVA
ncbi:KpsF/GutQ family sugar-phosphate isomerase [uncultured Cohaesibacter sp.]|uniref:KpsF/GutQ family sugar-phosphate isomerase n=1 Tax=uncultured Cohaesibacter sp. TaxID=1002546 RepID=UPI0029318C34|nr:KpsF/GutQ family sugar-phosphate isomerase [uncultured Cohaesibacter sp.]